MPTGNGLRERKKQRTRRELARAALSLFAEQGYGRTTVAQIAAEVEVSTKTFFSYFPSKPDVLFADADERIDAAIDVLAPETPPLQAIQRAIVVLLAPREDEDHELGVLRQRLIATEPAVQARALFHTLDAQSRLAEALYDTYPDALDRPAVVAAIGAIVGALIATLYDCVRHDSSADEMRQAAARATQIAIDGVASALS